VFVIGYSLPETDSFFRHLYALGSVGKAPLRKIASSCKIPAAHAPPSYFSMNVCSKRKKYFPSYNPEPWWQYPITFLPSAIADALADPHSKKPSYGPASGVMVYRFASVSDGNSPFLLLYSFRSASLRILRILLFLRRRLLLLNLDRFIVPIGIDSGSFDAEDLRLRYADSSTKSRVAYNSSHLFVRRNLHRRSVPEVKDPTGISFRDPTENQQYSHDEAGYHGFHLIG
jgi:hypothetical protein